MKERLQSHKRNTIAEIAAKAGVSVPTVSRVLNNRPDVAADTRELVERVLKETGFTRRRATQSLSRGASNVIDLVTPNLENPYTIEIVRSVNEALTRTAFRLALSTTHQADQLEQKWLTNAIDGATNGVILVLERGQSMSLDELRRHQIPFVVIDHRGELGADVPSVGATNWRGGRTATTYLLSLNHQRIGVLSGPATIQCSVERNAGYRAALEAANVPFDPALVRPGDYTLSMGYEQTCALLDLPDPPTAIFAGCDLQAMGVYSALRTRGISIPHEMSVIGFDDVQLASLVTPTLTTVRQPLVEMGQVATTMLLRQIAGEPLDTMRAELTTSLIIRESCAPRAMG